MNRIKNIGMWASILTATASALTLFSNTSDIGQKVGIIVTYIVTVAGIWSNPKEGIGYSDSNK